jgi:hypothetical protein
MNDDDDNPDNHLGHIREQVALLLTRLEREATGTKTPAPTSDETLVLARLLLRRIAYAEQSLATDDEAAAALQRIDAAYRDSIHRIDQLHERLEQTPPPQSPHLGEHGPSSGSTIGDAVRDSFLNL